jgi:hypothetical protein
MDLLECQGKQPVRRVDRLRPGGRAAARDALDAGRDGHAPMLGAAQRVVELADDRAEAGS